MSVAATREETESLLARIGDLYRAKTQASLRYAEQLAALKRAFDEEDAKFDREIAEAEEKVRGWCRVNRASICKPGQKTANFSTGLVKWRAGRRRVIISDTDKVIASIKSLGLTRFLRTKEEINQQALLAEPAVAETIPGVRIDTPPEDIIVEPVKAPT